MQFQLHVIPLTSAANEVIDFNIDSIDLFMNPKLMMIDEIKKKCCMDFYIFWALSPKVETVCSVV